MPASNVPGEGWGVLHLLYRIDHVAAREAAPGTAKELVATLERWQSELQLHPFTVLGHKGDLLVMALAADLTRLRALQTDLTIAASAAGMALVDSYLSLTEGSEYTDTPERYREQMAAKGLEGDDLDRRVEQFAERMAQ